MQTIDQLKEEVLELMIERLRQEALRPRAKTQEQAREQIADLVEKRRSLAL